MDKGIDKLKWNFYFIKFRLNNCITSHKVETEYYNMTNGN